MENKKEIKTWHVLLVGIVMSIITYIISVKPENDYNSNITTECKEDSLMEVISQLEYEIQIDEDGWDKKETRYENILFEYEYGLERIKETHPEAYKEFHRILSFKEKYSHEDERDNKKRLKTISKF